MKDFKNYNHLTAIDVMENKIKLDGDEQVILEAVKNHRFNAFIAKSIIEKNEEGVSSFFWFIQPNGELSKNNPFLLESHFQSGRYKTHKYYQSMLIDYSKGHSHNLTKLDANCKICYVDNCHYSNNFSKIIALKIIEHLKP